MSANLDLPTIAANQDQKEQTSNDADAQLDGALTDILSCDLSAGNFSLIASDFQSHLSFETTGNTVARNFTVAQKKRALFIITNGGTADVSVIRGSTTLLLAPNETGHFSTDGTSNGIKKINPNSEKDFAVIIPGLPQTGMTAILPMNQAVRFVTGLAGSHFAIGIDPSDGDYIITLKKGVSSIGTVTFDTGGSPTVSFVADVDFAVGDILSIIFPGTPDSTAANVGINLRGKLL